MGDGDGSKKILRTTSNMETLSLDVSANKFSRDLLQRFRGSSSEYKEVKEEDEGIELNLGLSLGGRFGVDKNSKKLARSSSIAGCLPVVKDDNDLMASTPVAYTGLVRTSSLPVETEEEWRKRKELQTLRRMEAKRRRSEKQRSLKGEKEGGGSGGGKNLSSEERKEIEVNLRERLEREKSLARAKKSGSSLGPQFGLSSWTAAAARQAILRGGIDVAMVKGKESHVGGSGGMQGFGQSASHGSVESKGGSSSSVSDLDSKTPQGSSDELSHTSIQSLKVNNPDVSSSGNKSREHTSKTTGSDKGGPSKRPDTSRTRGREIGANSLEDMPSVFTMGDGPNGRRVDGILYRYGKGEEVRIMCVCCGNFHSPAEFVVHAGGKDVDHPLKHIVINPHSSSLL